VSLGRGINTRSPCGGRRRKRENVVTIQKCVCYKAALSAAGHMQIPSAVQPTFTQESVVCLAYSILCRREYSLPTLVFLKSAVPKSYSTPSLYFRSRGFRYRPEDRLSRPKFSCFSSVHPGKFWIARKINPRPFLYAFFHLIIHQ
jgi:hypothetical protein